MFASTIALFNIFYTLTPLKESVVLVCLAYLAVKHSFSISKLRFIQERVRLLLEKPGSIKEPGALAVWHETLVALGLESVVL